MRALHKMCMPDEPRGQMTSASMCHYVYMPAQQHVLYLLYPSASSSLPGGFFINNANIKGA